MNGPEALGHALDHLTRAGVALADAKTAGVVSGPWADRLLAGWGKDARNMLGQVQAMQGLAVLTPLEKDRMVLAKAAEIRAELTGKDTD